MTAHINAKPGDFTPTAIMPGDPLRAKFTAENYPMDYREVTSVRNMLGYTGLYFGQPVSVIGHGMGAPSMTLYARELVHGFGIQRIIRVDGLGATQYHVRMRDITLAIAAETDSATNLKRSAGYTVTISAYFPLLQQAWTLAQKASIDTKVGNVSSGDLYYDLDKNLTSALEEFGVLGVDMEVAGLHALVHQPNIEALAILTVSDHCLTGEETIVEERRLTFNNMIKLAPGIAVTA